MHSLPARPGFVAMIKAQSPPSPRELEILEFLLTPHELPILSEAEEAEDREQALKECQEKQERLAKRRREDPELDKFLGVIERHHENKKNNT